MGPFRYNQDAIPTLIFFAVTIADLAIYLMVDNLVVVAAYWLLMIGPKGLISAWNHHHQHLPFFHHRALNRVLELSFALHTGATTNLWVLHHVHGHHMNYLDQSKDESRWQTVSGKTMGKYRYTLVTSFTSYLRAFEVGKKHARIQRAFIGYGLLTIAIVAALVAVKPLHGLLLYVLPMVTSLVLTTAATHEHHSGLETDDPLLASRNYTGKIRNTLTGNLGYHTAHHYRQGLHWSKLPELHAQLAKDIPDEYIATAPGIGKKIAAATAS